MMEAYLLVGRRLGEQRRGIYAETGLKIRRYIVTKVGTSAATGILVGSILALFGPLVAREISPTDSSQLARPASGRHT